MQIKGFDIVSIRQYVNQQLNLTTPIQDNSDVVTNDVLNIALERLSTCINAVRFWEPNIFNPLQSSQYATFLYFLSNTLWKMKGEEKGPTRLFLLNKMLNGIDCFYEIELPTKFFIGHSNGIVLSKAHYGERFVIYQNSTIGKNHDFSPTIGSDVIVYPNSAILGKTVVGNNVVVSQGTTILDSVVHSNKYVFQTIGRDFMQVANNDALINYYFRN